MLNPSKTQGQGGGSGVWPSLAQQLADAKAIPGSALEKLIKDNQDVGMLDPGEVDDVYRLPPWLRVWWRKKHPELNYKSHPVPYPPLLRRLRQWMLVNQDLNPDLIAPKAPLPPK